MLIEMTIKGLMLDPITNTPIVILKDKDGDRVLPIWVGLFEANAIALQIENVATPRPMTHDLLRNIITDLDGRVDRIVVSDLKENTFYAIVHLTVRGERVAVDARPSDAIALALRTRAPILVEENVIENAKTVDFGSERLDNEKVQKWLEALDPAESDGYAKLWAGRNDEFYWARDLVLRFTLADGSVFHRLYGSEAVLRKTGDHARFALNLPAELGNEVVQCEVLSRPLGQYAVESRLTEQDSAENYLDEAVVLATWVRE